MGEEGAAALAAALPALTGLRSLDLSGNGIGGAALAAALPALTGLQSLNLSYNNIGAQGKAAFAAFTWLQNLKLGG
jgi:hypothetical protein